MPEVKLTLQSLQEGAIEERFALALDQVLRNIANPNTKSEEKRKITIEIVFTPSEERDDFNIDSKITTKLAQLRPIKSRGYMEETGEGGFDALEIHKNQMRGQVEIVEQAISNIGKDVDLEKEKTSNMRIIKSEGK